MVLCIFCQIIKKEAPAHIIYEDEHVISFLDASPLSKGHTLVVPKRHYVTLLEIPTEELAYLMTEVQPIARSILKALNVTDFNLLQNNGKDASQVVGHLHFHIIPRPYGSLSWLRHAAVEREAIEANELNDICDKIKQHFI